MNEEIKHRPMLCVIMGPTASGKSALALRLAEKLNGEIVSADSMQLYRELAIGTAQPTAEERRQIPHHLVGCCELTERAEVFTYCERADAAIADVCQRGKLPIVTGGTGLYVRSLLYGLDDLPNDQKLRQELNARYDSEEGEAALREKMQRLDPAALKKFRSCRRRLLRALEVKLITGKSLLELQSDAPRPLRYPVTAWKIEYTPEVLAGRIARRTDEMLSHGWLEEARQALAHGLLNSPTAYQAIGYRKIGEYLEQKTDYDAMREAIIVATRQLARRQRTWFRHQHPEAETLDLTTAPDPLPGMIGRILREREKQSRR